MQATFRTYSSDIIAGVIIIIIIIFLQTWLMGNAIFFLDIGLVIGFGLWVVQTKKVSIPDITKLYFIAIGIQCFHFLEEYLTGFQTKFPLLFGYTWSDEQFVAFNLIWLGVLILNGVWLYSATRLSYLLVYCFAVIGGIGNGIGHPLLSLRAGGYFPGLITSPLLLIIGIVLLNKMHMTVKNI